MKASGDEEADEKTSRAPCDAGGGSQRIGRVMPGTLNVADVITNATRASDSRLGHCRLGQHGQGQGSECRCMCGERWSSCFDGPLHLALASEQLLRYR